MVSGVVALFGIDDFFLINVHIPSLDISDSAIKRALLLGLFDEGV